MSSQENENGGVFMLCVCMPVFWGFPKRFALLLFVQSCSSGPIFFPVTNIFDILDTFISSK